MTFARSAHVEEWFVNASGGLEHGFTVRERPAGDDRLVRLELSVDGARVHALADDTLAMTSGDATRRYEKLRVWDADGRVVSVVVAGAPSPQPEPTDSDRGCAVAPESPPHTPLLALLVGLGLVGLRRTVRAW